MVRIAWGCLGLCARTYASGEERQNSGSGEDGLLHHKPPWLLDGRHAARGWGRSLIVDELSLDSMAVSQGRGHDHAGSFAERLGQRADEPVGLGRLERNGGGLASVLNDGAGAFGSRRS